MANDTQFIDPFPDEEVTSPNDFAEEMPAANSENITNDFVDPFPDEGISESVANDDFDPLALSYEMPAADPEKEADASVVDMVKKGFYTSEAASEFSDAKDYADLARERENPTDIIRGLNGETSRQYNVNKYNPNKGMEHRQSMQRNIDSGIAYLVKAAKLPDSKALSRVMKAKGFGGALTEIAKDPVNVIVDAIASSAYPMAKVIAGGLSGGVLLGPAGFLAGTGMTSLDVNYDSRFMEAISNQGVDVTNPYKLAKALENKTITSKASSEAYRYALPIALLDTATAGIAGIKLSPSQIKNISMQTGIQATGGSAGEMLGGLNATGEFNSGEVLIEGLAELPGGVVDVAGMKLFGEENKTDNKSTNLNDISADELGDIPEDSTQNTGASSNDGGAGLVGPELKYNNGVDFDNAYDGFVGPTKSESFQENEPGIDFDTQKQEPSLGLVEPDAESKQQGLAPPEGFNDARLKRLEFRDRAKIALDEMIEGGGIELIPDPNFTPGESDKPGEVPLIRNKSQNPEWVQSLLADTGMTVEQVKNAVNKALKGETLGVRQGAAVQGVLDYISDQRTGDEYGNLDYAKQELEKARQIRQSIAQGVFDDTNNDWLYDELEYNEELDASGRIIFELLNEARAYGEIAEDEAISIAERSMSDTTMIAQLSQLIRDYKNYDQQEYEQIAGENSPQTALGEPQEGLLPETASPDGGIEPEQPPTGQQLGLTEPQQIEPSSEGFFDPGEETLNDEDFAPEVEQEQITELDDIDSIVEQALAENDISEVPDSAFNGDLEYVLSNSFQAESGEGVPLTNSGFTQQEITSLEKSGLATNGVMSREQFAKYDKERSERLKPNKKTKGVPKAALQKSAIDKAANEAATSPKNNLPEPTEAQKEAGNYKKGSVNIHGLEISIENPKGSKRRPEWPALKNHYGYIKNTKGADGDHIDVFLGDNAEEASTIFIIDQIDPISKKFDEHKVVIGPFDQEEAHNLYQSNYSKGWQGAGAISEMDINEFKEWLKGDTTKPVLYKEPKKGIPEAALKKTNSKTKKETKSYGKNNKVFTEDAAEKARALIKKKLNQLNSGVDPELMTAGITLAGYHIEAGARKFTDFSKAMIDDLGESVKPYLRAWYEGVRHWPEFNNKGMTSTDEIDLAKNKGMQEAALEKNVQAANAYQGKDSNNSIGRNNNSKKGAPKAVLKEVQQPDMFADSGEKATLSTEDNKNASISNNNKKSDQRAKSVDKKRRDGDNAGRVSGAGNNSQNGSGKISKTEGRSKESTRSNRSNEHGGNERTGDRNGSDNGRVDVPVRTNYRITEADLSGSASPLQKAQNNIAAIRILKTLRSENRGATAEEQKQLVKYVGWGSSDIANKMFPAKSKPTGSWKDAHDELREILTEEELTTAARSTQYAHYTSKTIIDSIYKAINGFGLTNGLAIEGGAGTGNFIGLIPDNTNLHYAAIEMDTISAGIAKALYPESGLIAGDFTKIHLPQNHYDLSIGNPPFANITVKNDPKYKANKFLLHDYFIAKQIDSVKEGGISVFVTSKGTMDKADSAAREYLNDKADLIGAIRLPQTAFKENAGTEVVTDILFFRKRVKDGEPSGVAWTNTKEISVNGGNANINEYFANHPEMILGESALTSSQFGEKYTVTPTGELNTQLAKAIESLPKGFYNSNLSNSEMEAKIKEFSLNPKDKESSYYIDDNNDLRMVQDGVGVVVPVRGGEQRTGLSKKKAEIARDYIPLRDAVMKVYREQLADGKWKEAQKELHKAYDAFTDKHGPINQSKTTVRKDGVEIVTEPIISVIDVDPEAYRVAGIENYDDATGKGTKGTIFTENVISRSKEAEIESATDALNVTLNDRGYIDMEYLAEKYNQPIKDILDELGVAVFKDPASGRYVTEDDYLSGNVKEKLYQAKEAGGEYSQNVKALEAVQPEDLPMSRIPVNLGALWIDSSIIEKFAKEVIGLNGTVRSFIKAENSSWAVDGTTDQAKYATSRLTAPKILEAALNKRTIKVYDTILVDGKEIRELNKTETAAANQKAQDLKDEFVRWGLSDIESAEKMHEKYNRVFNTVVPRKYNGKHLTLPRLSSRYKPHSWQQNVVWRILQRGNTYMAHTVGAGKTLASNIAGMELRRLGLAKKPTYVVLKSTLKQFATELLDAYPDAKILVADEKQLDKKNRRRFLARIANEDWDAIILTHQSFEKIPLSDEFIAEQINNDIKEFREILEEVDEDERSTRKTIERQIEGLEKRLESATAQDKKDAGLTFEELGIDFLFVDEAHTHKKVPFPTAQSNLKGVDSSGSGIAYDLYLKSKYLNTIKPNRNMVLMSGTPVTNTLGEVFNIQRYLQPEVLERNQISSFDAWTATFADTVTELEMQASGSFKPSTRLAKFVGVPALLRDFLMVADIVSDDTLKDSVTMKRPAIKTGARQLIAVPRTDEMKQFQEDLKERIEKLEERKGPPKKGDDNILVVITDARKASIDMRLVGRKQVGKSKLEVLIDNVYEQWERTKDAVYYKGSKEEPVTGSTQLIFTELRQAAGFDLYDYIRSELVKRGIPKSEIAFIQEATNSNKKKKLFRDMNTGVKRIMIGGSKNMGTGVNVQQRLKYIHHLDIDYLPANIVQREGRGVRQGNKNSEIGLMAYATEGTIDSFMWQLNETKQKMIDQVMNGDLSIDEVEDVSDSANQMAMAKALSSGNPLLLEQAGLTAEVKKLEALQAANINQNHANRRNAKKLTDRITRMKKQAKEIEELSSNYTSTKGDSFVMEIEGQKFTERKEAGIRLIRLADNLFADKVKDKVIGKISGYDITYSKGFVDWNIGLYDNDIAVGADGVKLYDGVAAYNSDSVAALGVVRKLENNAKELYGAPELLREQVEIAEKKLANLNNESGTEFQFSEDLKVKRERLDEINRSLESEDIQDDTPSISEQVTDKTRHQSGFSASKVEEIANDLTKNWKNKPKIIAVDSAVDLPWRYLSEILTSNLNSAPKAFIANDTNEVYILSDLMTSKEDVESAVFHEVLGHYGLRGLLGNDIDGMLNNVWNAFIGTKEMQSIVKKYRGKLNPNKPGDKAKLAEELLAKMAEKVNKQTLPQRLMNVWDKVVSFIKDRLRSLGMNIGLSKADLTSMLMKSADHVRKRTQKPQIGAKLNSPISISEQNDGNKNQGNKGKIQPGYTGERAGQRKTPHKNLGGEYADQEWHRKTVAVDGKGKPSILFRGDKRGGLKVGDFKSLGASTGAAPSGLGIFFTTEKAEASDYGDTVEEFHLDIRNPKIYTLKEFKIEVSDKGHIDTVDNATLFREGLRLEGYDGIAIDMRDQPAPVVHMIAFDSHQVIIPNNDISFSLEDNPGDVNDRASFRDRKWYKRTQMWLEENTPFKEGKIKNVSAWSKTVGSMYHLGQKEPSFKKVFDAGQEFLNDVSLMAIEAEKKAGSLFYRMDTVKQAVMQFASPKKAGIASDEDTSAVAIPVYRGTIIDEKVYTDAELKSQFNLNDTQIKLYHQVVAATQKSLDDTTKASMFRAAKIMGIDSQLLHGIRNATIDAKEFLELLYQHSLKPARGALKEEVATIKNNLETAPEEFKKIIQNELNDKQAEFKALEGSIANLYKMQAESKKLKDEGYFPLMRFGKYYVDAYSIDSEGKQVRDAFLMFENSVDARQAAEELQQEYPDSKVNAGIMSQEQHKLFQELTPETVALFAKQSGMDQSSAFQEYLKLAVSNRSAMKRLIKRKKTAGFSKDLSRTLASFIMTNARLSSAHYHMGDMVEAIDNIPSHKGDVKDMAVNLRDYLINPVEEFSKIRGFMFFQFLGGSISSALVNLTQVPMATFPYLSQWGTKQAGKLLTKWSLTNQKPLDSKHEADLKRAEQEGIVSPQEVYNLMATARGQQIPILKGKKAQSFLFMWGSMFSAAEQFNRRVTFNAAYEIARNEGITNAYEFAVKAVDESQFIYNKGNRPRWARGIGAPIFTFKQFMINYLEMLNRLPKKQRALAIALIILAAGLEGLPFAEDAEDILDTIMQWSGYNWNTRAKMIEWARDTFGKNAGDLISNSALRGITSAIPLDIQGRLSFGNIIPATSILKPSETNKGADAWEALGVTTSVVKTVGYGLSDIFKGNIGKGLYAMSPKAIRDVIKGVEMLMTGKYRDNRGKITANVKPVDGILKSIGFHPSRVSNIQRSQRSLQQLITLHSIMKQAIADKFARGIAFKEPGEVKEAKEDLKEWNKKNPDFPIAISSQSINQRVMQFMLPSDMRLMKRTPPEIRNKIYKAMK